MIENEDQWLDSFRQDVEPMMRGEVSEAEWRPKHSLEEVLSSVYADHSYIRVYSYQKNEYDMIFSNPILFIKMETGDGRHVYTLMSRAWFVWMDGLDPSRTLHAISKVSHGLSSETISDYKELPLHPSYFLDNFITRLKSNLYDQSEKMASSELASVLLRWKWLFDIRKELGLTDSSTTLEFVASLLNP